MEYALKDWTADTATELHILGAKKITGDQFLKKLETINHEGYLVENYQYKQTGCLDVVCYCPEDEANSGWIFSGVICKNIADYRYLQKTLHRFEEQAFRYLTVERIRRGGRFIYITNVKRFVDWLECIYRQSVRKGKKLPQIMTVEKSEKLFRENLFRALIDEGWNNLVDAFENHRDLRWWDKLGQDYKDAMAEGKIPVRLRHKTG